MKNGEWIMKNINVKLQEVEGKFERNDLFKTKRFKRV